MGGGGKAREEGGGRRADGLGELLELGAGQPLRPQVPEHEVVVGTARDDGVASRHERGGERLRVRLDTPDVLAEGWLLRLQPRVISGDLG